jgi:hypothetical protein
MSLTDIKRDLAKRESGKKPPVKFKYKQKKGSVSHGSDLSVKISNTAHKLKVQSKNPGLYDSSGKAYAHRKKKEGK